MNLLHCPQPDYRRSIVKTSAGAVGETLAVSGDVQLNEGVWCVVSLARGGSRGRRRCRIFARKAGKEIAKEAKCRSTEGPYEPPACGPTAAPLMACRAPRLGNGFIIEALPERG
jgi:hypothetical protein